MPQVAMAHRKDEILNAFQDFFYATKSAGICMINSQTGELVFSFGLNHETKQLIKEAVDLDCFSNLNVHVSSFFINKRELDFIQVQGEVYNRFIKVIDKDFFLYAYFDKARSQDYGKIKFHLSAVKTKLAKIHA